MSSVNPDCMGTGAAKTYASGTEISPLTFNVSFDDNMKERRAIFTSARYLKAPLATVINLEARKQ